MATTGKQRADLSRARRDCLMQLGEAIESLEMADNSRIQLRLLFVQTMLACKQQPVLGQMMAVVPGYAAIVRTASEVLDEIMKENPNSPLAIIINAANDDAAAQLGEGE